MSQEFFFIFLTSVPAIFFKEYPPPPHPRGSLMTGVLDSIFGPQVYIPTFVMRTIFSHTHATKLLAHFALKLRLRLYLSKIHAMKAPK